MHLELDGEGALYDQIYRALKGLIDAGVLERGERVPGSRTLMADLSVSRNSVLTALHMLQVEGYLETRPGAGTFVCMSPRNQAPGRLPPSVQRGLRMSGSGKAAEASPKAATAARFRLASWMGRNEPVRYDFRHGRVAFPPASWKAWCYTQTRVLRRTPAPPPAAPFQGEPALREAICMHLRLNRGIDCEAEQIVVTSGSQESIHLAMAAVLTHGDRVIVEKPGYLPVRAVAELCGAEVRGVAVDGDGLRTEDLGSEPARLVFVTPSHQFPTGAVLSASRRLALYAWARQHGTWICEDDYDSEFRYDMRPLPALKSLDDDQRVLHAGTFSKTMYSGLRLGFLVLPQALVETITELKTCMTGAAPQLVQRAMAEFIASGDYQRHLNRVRKVYRERRDRLLASLSRELGERARWTGSQGGVHLYLTFRRPFSAAALARIAAAGVGVTAAAPDGRGRSPNLVLGYGAIQADDVEAGIRALARAVAAPPGRSPR